MKAAVLHAPGDVRVGEFDRPEPGADEVLVRMVTAAICGSDLHHVFEDFHVAGMLGVPGYPGHEGVGVVEASRSPRFTAGQLVLTVPSGSAGRCFADFQVVDADHLVELPADADPLRIVHAQQLGTTVYALNRFLPVVRGCIGEPTTAAVLGAGSAGLFFLQQLLGLGLRVLVSDPDPVRLQVAADLGATVTVRDAGTDTAELRSTAADLSDGVGIDLVVDAAGLDVNRAQAVEIARTDGVAGFFGYAETAGLAPFPVYAAFRKSVSGLWISGTQSEPGLRSFRRAVEMITTSAVTTDHLSGAVYALDDAADAFVAARERRHGAAKVVFRLG